MKNALKRQKIVFSQNFREFPEEFGEDKIGLKRYEIFSIKRATVQVSTPRFKDRGPAHAGIKKGTLGLFYYFVGSSSVKTVAD